MQYRSMLMLGAAALVQAALGGSLALAQSGQGGAEGAAVADAPEADVITVTGTRAQGYRVVQTDVLGLSLDIAKSPAAITVLSDSLLEDLGARSLATVLPYAAGVSNGDNGGVNTDEFVVRGFPVTQNFVNGIRQNITAEGRPSIDTIEQVQILKGPAGVEASVTAPGGFVNIITKKPQDKFAAVLFGSVGDYRFRRAGVDITGPVLGDAVTARLIAAYENKQIWRPGRQERPIITIAPSVNWKITPDTNLLVEYQYGWQNDTLDRGTIYARGIRPDSDFLPRNFSFHQRFDSLKAESHRIDADLKHRFNDIFSVRLHYQNFAQDGRQRAVRNGNTEGTSGGGGLFLDDGLTFSGNSVIDIFIDQNTQENRSETFVGEVTARFDIGSTSHTFNVGGSTAKNSNLYGAYNKDFIYIDQIASFDVLNPTDRLTAADFSQDTLVFANFIDGDRIDSVFGQWLGEWTPRFRTVISARYDDARFTQGENIDGIAPDVLQIGVDQGFIVPESLFSLSFGSKIFSFRVATSYDITETLTAFAGYARSGEPQNGRTRDNEAVAPKRGTSVEAGLKLKLAEDAALASISVYRIDQTKIAISDPTNLPIENFLLPLGSARVDGVELELVGKLTPSLSVFGGLSIQDAKITESDSDIVGNRFANVPRFQASLFTNWNARDLGVPGLDIGLGILHQGEREGNSGNQYQLPAYTRVDLGASYTFDSNLEVRLQVNNLFDTTYYTSSQDTIFGSDQIGVGDRRLMQLSLTKRF